MHPLCSGFLVVMVAFGVCRNSIERIRFVFIGIILGFVLLFAVPAG